MTSVLGTGPFRNLLNRVWLIFHQNLSSTSEQTYRESQISFSLSFLLAFFSSPSPSSSLSFISFFFRGLFCSCSCSVLFACLRSFSLSPSLQFFLSPSLQFLRSFFRSFARSLHRKDITINISRVGAPRSCARNQKSRIDYLSFSLSQSDCLLTVRLHYTNLTPIITDDKQQQQQ